MARFFVKMPKTVFFPPKKSSNNVLFSNELESKSQKQDTLSKEPTLKSEQFSFAKMAKTVFFHLFYDGFISMNSAKTDKLRALLLTNFNLFF